MLLDRSSRHFHGEERKAWGAVVAMSLAAFALVASEFMPVSLLTPLATDLLITEGQAGMGISVSGLFALFTALLITPIAAKVERKRLLLSMILLMVISGTIVAFAANYEMFMAGRALIGVAIGGFWSLSAATSIRLVPAHQVPKALALVNGGNALATVIAAPVGSYLGAFIGWRWAFFTVVPVAMIALAWIMLSMPRLAPRPTSSGSGNVLLLLKKPPIALGMLAVAGFFMGQFMLFTYLRPFLETVTRLDISMVSFVLLLIGVGGLIGTFLIGAFLKDGGLYKTLVSVPIMMAIIALALVEYGDAMLTTAVLLVIWGLIATATPVAWFTWIARSVPNDVEAGGGLFVAICQLAIALGGTVGGILFDTLGYRATFEVSALLLAATAVLSYLAGRSASQMPISPM
ncbi:MULTISPECIES: MFS transporter [Pectobacterium]|uniref:MFS transporter n=1 Tax=Pectobacterium parvum TaxID=2778550 RepID=A0AAP9II01_9GAMM|nr:MFS transporter [Pectobacterium parvum]MCU1803459.1 MFS transporter [Pectobacterium parvum]QHQ25265.1 MFS transporter [Pectobacterium parvum]UVD96176.1 MFS transporter [Pectobacterium parvum]